MDNDKYWIHMFASVIEDLDKLKIAACPKEKRSLGESRNE